MKNDINRNLDFYDQSLKEKIVIVAVSGGPDSMALLAYLEKEKRPYVIAHINYQKRPSAFYDESIVRDWATKYHRPLWVFYPQKKEPGNFQAWARQVRYTFFLKLAMLYQSQEIWLGHHMDDALETWMLQKKRHSLPTHFGLQEKSDYQGYTLVRPFLQDTFVNWRKKDFEKFCQENEIAYGIDESNLTSDYERNQIRHEKVETASFSKREEWIGAMKKDNETLKEMHQKAQILLESGFEVLKKDPLGWLALEKLIYQKTYRHHSQKEMEDLLTKLSSLNRQVLSGQLFENIKMDLEVPWSIQVIANQIHLVKNFFIPFYIDNKEQLQSLCKMQWQSSFFKLSDQGKNIEAFFVESSDFPLIIRSFQEHDCLAMRFGHKKVSRLFIDRKIPAAYRSLYPVIESHQTTIFATLAGADKEHYRNIEDHRFYMLK